MGFHIPRCTVGGPGSVVKRPWRFKGLRNKRKAHWARMKREEDIQKMKRQREAENRFNYDNPYEQFNYDERG